MVSASSRWKRTGHAQCWLDLRGARGGPLEDARTALLPPRQERFIGVIYRPETELQSHYARATHSPPAASSWLVRKTCHEAPPPRSPALTRRCDPAPR
ncbi:erythromycin esterase family protein [Cupriavidus sp. NPDC089707]|uniref:erythromycin esterase family protein n=1 Tax=Cupriavidus sp. NPDC089707 TaxID=3363963 RepID=UPI00380E3BC9